MALKDFFSKHGSTLTGFALGGIGGAIIGKTQSSKKEAESKISSAQSALEESLASTKTYETPEEAYKIQELSQASAENLRGIADIGQQAVDVAEAQAGASQAPGAIQARADLEDSTARSVQSILEAGGSGASALGAISEVNRGEMESLRQLSAANQQYMAQANKELYSALTNQASLEANLESQALSAETTGLQAMINEKDKEYQSYLDKTRTQQQYDIYNLGNMYSSEEARKNRNSQIFSDIVSGVSGLASSLI